MSLDEISIDKLLQKAINTAMSSFVRNAKQKLYSNYHCKPISKI